MVEPETSPSLTIRLRDPGDQQAWTEFVAIYEPFLLRIMRQRGLQEADARDVTQQVVFAVTQAVERWRPDGRAASFRRWLFSIARMQALRFVQRGSPLRGPARRGVGGSDMVKLLQSLPEPEHRTISDFDNEYRNEVFERAAQQVKSECRDATWEAFWRTCVLNQPVAQVSADLEMTAGAVYVARCRIVARLRRIVEEYEAEDDAQ